MKKIFLLLGGVTLLTLTSCTKEWTCKCTDNNGDVTYHTIPDATLNDADNTCESFEYNNAIGYNNCSLLLE